MDPPEVELRTCAFATLIDTHIFYITVPICSPTSHVGECPCLMVTPNGLPGLASKNTRYSVKF